MGVDRAPIQALIRDFGAVPPALKREWRSAMLKVGRPVLMQMKANASWSTRIPAATTMRPSSTTAGVEFRVNAMRAPHARPYENGSQRNPGMVRHPLWGNRKYWAQTPVRPFFYRAVQQHADQVAQDLGDTAMAVAARHGL